MTRKKAPPPNVALLLEAGLAPTLALEAALRQLQGGRLAHWARARGLHSPTVSAVLLGRRRDSTIRGAIAAELRVDPLWLCELLDSLNE
jgi:hypothetical protein